MMAWAKAAPRFARGCGAAAAVALVVACAPTPHWVKEETSAEQVERDVVECRFEAQSAARAEATPGAGGEEFVGVGPGGQRLTVQIPGAGELDYGAERERFRQCMEARGYRIEPPPEGE